jgi:hypothetical protein
LAYAKGMSEFDNRQSVCRHSVGAMRGLSVALLRRDCQGRTLCRRLWVDWGRIKGLRYVYEKA